MDERIQLCYMFLDFRTENTPAANYLLQFTTFECLELLKHCSKSFFSSFPFLRFCDGENLVPEKVPS